METDLWCSTLAVHKPLVVVGCVVVVKYVPGGTLVANVSIRKSGNGLR